MNDWTPEYRRAFLDARKHGKSKAAADRAGRDAYAAAHSTRSTYRAKVAVTRQVSAAQRRKERAAKKERRHALRAERDARMAAGRPMLRDRALDILTLGLWGDYQVARHRRAVAELEARRQEVRAARQREEARRAMLREQRAELERQAAAIQAEQVRRARGLPEPKRRRRPKQIIVDRSSKARAQRADAQRLMGQAVTELEQAKRMIREEGAGMASAKLNPILYAEAMAALKREDGDGKKKRLLIL